MYVQTNVLTYWWPAAAASAAAAAASAASAAAAAASQDKRVDVVFVQSNVFVFECSCICIAEHIIL